MTLEERQRRSQVKVKCSLNNRGYVSEAREAFFFLPNSEILCKRKNNIISPISRSEPTPRALGRRRSEHQRFPGSWAVHLTDKQIESGSALDLNKMTKDKY